MASKLSSRTFWFAVVWTSFIPLGLFLSAKFQIVLPLGEIVTLAGVIVTAYIGGNKIVKIKQGQGHE